MASRMLSSSSTTSTNLPLRHWRSSIHACLTRAPRGQRGVANRQAFLRRRSHRNRLTHRSRLPIVPGGRLSAPKGNRPATRAKVAVASFRRSRAFARHPAKFRGRRHAELLHHLRAMRLHGAKTDAEIIGDLLVEHAGDDPLENRQFPRREQIQARLVPPRGVERVTPHNVRFQRPSQRFEQRLTQRPASPENRSRRPSSRARCSIHRRGRSER